MRKDLPFKFLLGAIIMISCTLLFVSVPFLIKVLRTEINLENLIWNSLFAYLNNIYLGTGTGIAASIFILLKLDGKMQIKVVRFLLILSTMLTAIVYILIKSVS